MAKTMVAIFDEASDAKDAVHGLLDLGLKREDIGLFAHRPGEDVDEETAPSRARERLDAQVDAGNALIGAMTGAFVGLGLATVPVIGPILAVGPLALGAIGAGIGERYESWVAALTGFGISSQDATEYAEGVRRGGVLVVARVHDDWVERARRVLEGAHAVDLGARAVQWRLDGWTGEYGVLPAEAAGAARELEIPRARTSIAPDRPSRPSVPM